MLIFVYGTLKTGEPNHSLIQEQTHGQCVLKGKGITVEKYPLVIATYCNVPFLLYKPGIGHVSFFILYFTLFYFNLKEPSKLAEDDTFIVILFFFNFFLSKKRRLDE